MISAILDFAVENPIAVSQTLLSFALVVATTIYTYFTWDQTSEMAQTRETSNQPVVKGGVESMAGGHLMCVVRNTGNGAAHDVYAKIHFEDVDIEPIEFRTSIMGPGEAYEFGLPLDDRRGFVTANGEVESLIEDHESEGILTVETECESPFGDEYDYEVEIDVMDVRENLTQMIRKSEEEKIRSALEGIESNLRDLEKGIAQQYQDAQAYQVMYQEVVDTVESAEKIGFEDLKSRVGITDNRILRNMINRLQRAGLVNYPEEEQLWGDNNVMIVWVGESHKKVNERSTSGVGNKATTGEIQSNETEETTSKSSETALSTEEEYEEK